MPTNTPPAHRNGPRDDTGAGIVEYVLLIVAIALVVSFSMTVLGDRLGDSFASIGEGVAGAEGDVVPDGADPGEPGPTPTTIALAKGWDPEAIYGEGDTVSLDGRTWEALWWSKSDKPGASNNGPWQEIATSRDGTAVWTSSRVFDTGDTVVHDGVTYKAQWWTRNQRPGNPNGPWQPVK